MLQRKNFSRFLFLSFLSVLIVSCTEDTNDPTDTDARTKFIRNWKCREVCNGEVTFYNSNITANPTNTSQVYIYNIYSLGNTNFARATVAGNSISIGNQQIDAFTISGSGNYTNDKIEFNYTVNDGSGNITVQATYTPL
jgi:hypothetical protein